MPNDVGSRQWRLDTPIAFGQPGALLWQGNACIEHFEFSGYTSQGQLAIIKDSTGRIVWQASGAADLEEVRSGKIGWVNGVVLDTLQDGLVIAYIR